MSHLHMYKSVCVQWRGDTNAKNPLLARTSDAHTPEVLIGAVGVVAGAASTFVLAQGLLRIDLMAKCRRQEATWNILRKVRMVAIRFEHAKRALIRGELGYIVFLVGNGYLLWSARLHSR